MNVAGFEAQVLGQCIGQGGLYGCQCVNLADAWAAQLGAPLPLVAVAADFVAASIPGWAWIENAPDNAPQAGDLVVWDRRIGPAGHVDVCLGGDPARFTGLDQNWFQSNSVTGSPAAEVQHTYYGVAGWLRFIGGGHTVPATPFWINTHPDARWFAQPDGQDMGAAAALSALKILEVANDGVNDWFRWEGGAWWLLGNQCDQVAPPPAPAPAPPATDLEARVRILEHQMAGIRGAVS